MRSPCHETRKPQQPDGHRGCRVFAEGYCNGSSVKSGSCWAAIDGEAWCGADFKEMRELPFVG
jgi:hypothetical protein